MQASYKKGAKFEEFVLRIFNNDKKFTLIRVTKYRRGIYVEDNLLPDITVRDEHSGLQFDIECKWRSKIDDAFKLKRKNYEKYKRCENLIGRPVFVALGLGISEENKNFFVPKEFYIIPLRCFSEKTCSVKLSEKFRHTINDPFSVKPFRLF